MNSFFTNQPSFTNHPLRPTFTNNLYNPTNERVIFPPDDENARPHVLAENNFFVNNLNNGNGNQPIDNQNKKGFFLDGNAPAIIMNGVFNNNNFNNNENKQNGNNNNNDHQKEKNNVNNIMTQGERDFNRRVEQLRNQREEENLARVHMDQLRINRVGFFNIEPNYRDYERDLERNIFTNQDYQERQQQQRQQDELMQNKGLTPPDFVNEIAENYQSNTMTNNETGGRSDLDLNIIDSPFCQKSNNFFENFENKTNIMVEIFLEENEVNGYGNEYTKDGILFYNGQFYKGRREGAGIEYFKKIVSKKCRQKGVSFGPELIKQYEGYWKNGDRDGHGKSFYEDGKQQYDGQWKSNKMEGLGKFYDKTGVQIYEGELKSGIKDGYGMFYYSENCSKKYEGYFKSNLCDYIGTQYSKTGQIIYKGGFKNNLWNSKGIFYDEQGFVKYSGAWKDSKREGKGKGFYKDSNQVEYDGYWNKDARDGKGVSYYPNGVIKYDGYWSQSKYDDHGVIYDEFGLKDFEGFFINSMKNGHGTKYNKFGDVFLCGKWTADILTDYELSIEEEAKGFQVLKCGDKYQMYIGQTLDDVPHGEGFFINTLTGFKQSEGMYKFGKTDGFLKWFYAVEEPILKFSGQSENGLINGKGRFYFVNGKMKYQGYWKQNFANFGFGVEFDESGCIKKIK